MKTHAEVRTPSHVFLDVWVLFGDMLGAFFAPERVVEGIADKSEKYRNTYRKQKTEKIRKAEKHNH